MSTENRRSVKEPTFVPGDVVRLKSGGPKYTIENVISYSNGAIEVQVVWAIHNEDTEEDGLFRATFNQDVLELSEGGM